MGDILRNIAARLREDHGAAWAAFSRAAWTPGRSRALHPFPPAGAFSLIAELKKASPSKGVIRADFDVDLLADAYREGGAAALSVLTEGPHFQGSMDNLRRVAARSDLVILRKEFVVHEAQVAEAFDAGADMVLLIAALLSDAELAALQSFIRSLGMTALVEVHDETELRRSLALGASPIGVNNRDLRTFRVDFETSFRLQALAPAGLPMIAESGIEEPEQITRLRDAGFAGALVGESLLRQTDVEAATRRLLSMIS